MKHTVHVTVVFSVEVDDSKLKAEFGRVSEKMVVQYAMNHFDVHDAFHTEAKIIESYDDPIPLKRPRKGIGSY